MTGLNTYSVDVHPTLLKMAKVINEEQITPTEGVVVSKLTLKFPTLSEVHQQYDSYFTDLREKGDEMVEAKEKSFYDAIQKDLDKIGPSRTLIVEQPFLEI